MSDNGNGYQFRHKASDVAFAADRRWPEILTGLAGIPRESLDRRHHACPRCGGTDRFRLLDPDKGAVICNQCFRSDNGDGIQAVAWMLNINRAQAINRVGDFLGLTPQNGEAKGAPIDALEAVCRAKRMPKESAVAYGARAVNGAVVFPMFGPDGAQCSEFTIWPSGNENRRKGLCAKGKPAGVFLPLVEGKPRLPQAGETWLVVEGCKDACALAGLGYLAMGAPTCSLAQKFAKLLRDCIVVLIPDRDVASIDGMDKSARRLYGVASGVSIAALPAEVTPKDGKDVRDILAQPDGERLVREAIEQAQPFVVERAEGGPDHRPAIYDGPKEHEVATEAIKALAGLDGIYQRGGNLVSVVRSPEPPKGIIRPPSTYYISAIDDSGLCDLLSQAARFYQLRTRGDDVVEVDVPPPLRIAKIVHSRRRLPDIPVMEGVVHAPVLLADGGIMTTPGYCRATGLYLAAGCEFPQITQSPTKADAEAARDLIMETVCDFPFATAAHKAAWLALALTPAARFAFDGPVPLGAFDANVRGSGKSKLADSIGMIHLGDMLPRTAPPTSDEEFRKKVTSVLLAGEQIVLIDNVTGMLGGASLDALLTGTSWSDRILGQSKMTGKLAALTIWYATGNNMIFEADTSRRALTVRLQSQEENPEEREGFRHPNLLAWVKANRGRLATAAVTILRAYHVAGRPKLGLAEWGSFEGWSNLVRNAVVWLGMDDPGATRQEVREQSDREAGLLRQLLAAWESGDPGGFGMTVQEAIGKAASGNELLQAVFAEIGTPGKPPSSRSIGMKLHHLRARVTGGKFFDRRKGVGHSVVWAVESSESQGTTGTKGTKPYSPYAPAGAHAHAHAHAHTREADSSPPSPLSPPTAEPEARTWKF